MAHNIEAMFYTREAPWHGLGKKVEEALSSNDALTKAGLDWNVIQRSILTDTLMELPGFKANIRDTDNRYLVSSPIATRSFKIMKPLLLPMTC